MEVSRPSNTRCRFARCYGRQPTSVVGGRKRPPTANVGITIHSKPDNRRRGPNAGYVELCNANRWGRGNRLRDLGPGKARALVNGYALLALRG